MTLDDLTVSFQHLQRETVLSDWMWLLGASTLPVLITAVGNAFVQDPSSGEIKLLDVGSAELVPVAASTAEFEDLLAQQEFVAKFFDVQLVGELLKSGQTLAVGELFGFKRLPTVGGDYVINNFEPTDIEVHFGVSGQLQAQVSRLEPGTVVRSVSIGDAGH
jgi:hypothetical protein